MIAILHSIRSLHNVGSIFRTADAAGVAKLYLCGITPSPLDRFGKVQQQLAKVSLGAEHSVAWEKVSSTARLIDQLKKDGYQIFAIEQSKKSIPYFSAKGGSVSGGKDKRLKVAVLVGNEVKGLPKPILKKSDTILEIPMRGAKESLNVAVAFGIVAFRINEIFQNH